MRFGSVVVVLASLGASIVWARSPQSGQARRPASASGTAEALAYAPCDYDNDGRIDHFLFGPTSRARLIANLGQGKTEDRTEDALLAGVGFVAQAYWRDLDSDRWQDLIVLSPEGWLRVFSGNGQVFEETSAELAGAPCANVQAVEFEDYDLNGWLDVRVQCRDGSRTVLFNSGNHQFVPGEDPFAMFGSAGGGSPAFLGTPPPGCAESIKDQSSPATCLNASSIPALGRLYMMTSSLFVKSSGEVGVSTSTPAPGYALDVNGVINARQGIRLPDNSILTGAIPAGAEGPPGPEGPEGPAGGAVPTGTILMWATPTPPDGFLLCDGVIHNTADYLSLGQLLGAMYGGNGASTFGVPNLEQRFPMGKADSGTGSVLGSIGGQIDHEHDMTHTHNLPSHTHSLPAHSHDVRAHTHGVGTLAVAGGGDHSHEVTKLCSNNPTAFSNEATSQRMSSVQGGSGAWTMNTFGVSSSGTHTHSLSGSVGSGAVSGDANQTTINTSAASITGGSAANAISQQNDTTTGGSNPPFLAVYFIIKT